MVGLPLGGDRVPRQPPQAAAYRVTDSTPWVTLRPSQPLLPPPALLSFCTGDPRMSVRREDRCVCTGGRESPRAPRPALRIKPDERPLPRPQGPGRRRQKQTQNEPLSVVGGRAAEPPVQGAGGCSGHTARGAGGGAVGGPLGPGRSTSSSEGQSPVCCAGLCAQTAHTRVTPARTPQAQLGPGHRCRLAAPLLHPPGHGEPEGAGPEWKPPAPARGSGPL